MRGKGGQTPGFESSLCPFAASGTAGAHARGPREGVVETMTRNKDLKRLVRARMGKTGEAYTTARAHVLAQPRSKSDAVAAAASPASQPAPPPDYAALAGMSDATIKAKTGCGWEKWVFALDRRGAAQMPHGDIAAIVHDKYKIDGWWAQAVTVGYERIKGLRALGQRRDGSYEASKSRTFDVPVSVLFGAWADARVRRRWLDGTVGRVRTATPQKSMRLDGQDRSIVAVGFLAKGPSKSAVAVQHTKLPDRETATRLKQYWSERFDALAEVLTPA
jgi:hypothetical protein